MSENFIFLTFLLSHIRNIWIWQNREFNRLCAFLREQKDWKQVELTFFSHLKHLQCLSKAYLHLNAVKTAIFSLLCLLALTKQQEPLLLSDQSLSLAKVASLF